MNTPDVQAQLIDGKALAQDVRREVREEVDRWTSRGHRAPYLAVVLVGDDPASHAYVRGKTRAAGEAGIESDTLVFGADVGQEELMSVVARLNRDADVDGILVQLPLPDHLDADAVIQSISPDKDVDGLTHANAGRLVVGADGFVPATPAGVVEMLRRTGIETSGRHAVVVGAVEPGGEARWRTSSSAAAPTRRSPSATAGRGTSPRSPARLIFSSPPSGGRVS